MILLITFVPDGDKLGILVALLYNQICNIIVSERSLTSINNSLYSDSRATKLYISVASWSYKVHAMVSQMYSIFFVANIINIISGLNIMYVKIISAIGYWLVISSQASYDI